MGTLAEGIKEIFATAKNTGSNVMLCGNDGTPDGHITMANLAIVLGVLGDMNNDTLLSLPTHDANDAVYGVQYWCKGTETNIPNNDEGILLSFKGAWAIQIFANKTSAYVREYYYSSWGSWQQIALDYPLFYKNYSDLASLASALGVIPQVQSYLTNKDVNDYTNTGLYYFYGGTNQNQPTQYFMMFTINFGQLDIIQFGIGLVSLDFYVRSYTGSWSAWKKVQYTA